ncbi:L-type lectin-like domain-containing protein [Sphaceloma murrayae]|uniref:L-type lectin-like domain-containing protein n=1 Tax=Sphaceloma murrayae TaxID=2082308 RepID=A0A2K1R091_9PEZI|nr:L-type lectin-like domain-containing protein [Sphaceloma murrayae]
MLRNYAVLASLAWLPSSYAAVGMEVLQPLSLGQGPRISPNGRAIPEWHLSGEGHTPQILSDRIIVTPPAPGHARGALWNEHPNSESEWMAEAEFRASGSDRGSGNFQIWYVNHGRSTIGANSVYTAPKFEGLVLTVDQHGGRGGMLRGFLNDGTTDYKNHHMVDSLAFGHCDFFYRNLGRSSKIKLTHDQRGLEVKIDDQLCFSSDKVALPSGYIFGMTAATADNPDSFEVNKFTVIKTHNAPHSGHFNQPPSQNQARDTEKHHLPNAPEQIPDRDATSIKKQEEQFADLHNRLQGLSHQVNNIFNEFDRLARDINGKHQEIMSRSQGGRGVDDAIRTMSGRVENIEHIVHGLERDLASRDYGHHLHELHQAVTGGLPDTLHAVVKSSAPKITTFVFIVIAAQVALLGLYILYKKRRDSAPKKFLSQHTDVEIRDKTKAVTQTYPSTRGQTHRLNEFVNTKSLDRTLENHREANNSLRIRKIGIGTDKHVIRPTDFSEVQNGAGITEITVPVARQSSALYNKSSKFLEQSGLAIGSKKSQIAIGIAQNDQESRLRVSRVVRNTSADKAGSVAKSADTASRPRSATKIGYQIISKAHATAFADSSKWSRPYQMVKAGDEFSRSQNRKLLLKAFGKSDIPQEINWTNKHEVLKILKIEYLPRHRSQSPSHIPRWDILEYAADYVPLVDEQLNHESREPWNVAYEGDYTDQLNQEIGEFTRWIEPTQAEAEARRTVSQLAVDIATRSWSDLGACVYGSEISGLATPVSDVDIRLFDPSSPVSISPSTDPEIGTNDIAQRVDRTALLNKLKAGVANVALALSSHPDFDSVTLQRHPFPLVQATHLPSGLKVQFVAGPPTQHSQVHIQRSLTAYPVLKPIYHLFKTVLSSRDLLTPYHGHLSSYGLFNLIRAVLLARQTMYTALVSPPPRTAEHNKAIILDSTDPSTLDTIDPSTLDPACFFPSLQPSPPFPSRAPTHLPSPAALLLDILHFLPRFNTYKFGISAHDGLLFRKRNVPPRKLIEKAKTDQWARGINEMAPPVSWQGYLLSLQDGADAGNDLGRKVVGWKLVAATLDRLEAHLTQQLQGKEGTDGIEKRDSSGRRPMPAFSTSDDQDQEGEIRTGTGAERWSLGDGMSPPPSPRKAERKAPMIRRLVGRPDLAYEKARTRLELFAEGHFEWEGAGARKDEPEGEREKRWTEYADYLHTAKVARGAVQVDGQSVQPEGMLTRREKRRKPRQK